MVWWWSNKLMGLSIGRHRMLFFLMHNSSCAINYQYMIASCLKIVSCLNKIVALWRPPSHTFPAITPTPPLKILQSFWNRSIDWTTYRIGNLFFLIDARWKCHPQNASRCWSSSIWMFWIMVIKVQLFHTWLLPCGRMWTRWGQKGQVGGLGHCCYWSTLHWPGADHNA